MDHDKWPNAEASTGIHYQNVKFGRNECWEAVGEARQNFKEIAAQLKAHLNEYADPIANPVVWTVYMIGKSRKDSRPIIMFCSRDKNARNEIRAILKQSGILKRYPGFRTGSGTDEISCRLMHPTGLESKLSEAYESDHENGRQAVMIDERVVSELAPLSVTNNSTSDPGQKRSAYESDSEDDQGPSNALQVIEASIRGTRGIVKASSPQVESDVHHGLRFHCLEPNCSIAEVGFSSDEELKAHIIASHESHLVVHSATNLSRSPSMDSLQSLVDSIFSTESFSSASTTYTTNNAFQRVTSLFKTDANLIELYGKLSSKISAEKFKRNFSTLLKRFALALEKEAKCWNEQQASKFIRSRARVIAQNIADSVYPSEHHIEKTRHVALDPDQAELSEESDVEEEPDEFIELEKFITNSIAFQSLCSNIRGFLRTGSSSRVAVLDLESTALFLELPFAADEDEALQRESISYGPPTSPGTSSAWYLADCLQKIMNLLLPERPIPDGLLRSCGMSLYDDYQELKPGAAKRMEDFLRRAYYKACTVQNKGSLETISHMSRSWKNLAASFKQAVQALSLKDKAPPDLVNTEPRYYSEGRNTRVPAHTSGEVFYLLLCHNAGIGSEIVKLRQPDVCDINDDQKLFFFLSEEYVALRQRWWSWISLWTLQSIKFVRFELYENELVDVKKLDEVPPPTKDDEYRHGPPNPPELNPPLGSNLLMHLFRHPELAGLKKHCLRKIPRKLQNRLAVLDEEKDTIGWGLQFVEGWSKKRLMYMTALTFGLSSFVVMVLVSILDHDIQNAGAIASFMLSFVTIGIATAQAALHIS